MWGVFRQFDARRICVVSHASLLALGNFTNPTDGRSPVGLRSSVGCNPPGDEAKSVGVCVPGISPHLLICETTAFLLSYK